MRIFVRAKPNSKKESIERLDETHNRYLKGEIAIATLQSLNRKNYSQFLKKARIDNDNKTTNVYLI